MEVKLNIDQFKESIKSIHVEYENYTLGIISQREIEEIVKRVNGHEKLEELIAFKNNVIDKMDEACVKSGKEIMRREDQRAGMQYKIDVLQLLNRELAKALEYIANDVTEETIAGGIRALKKYKGVE